MAKSDFSSKLAQDLGRGVVVGFQPLYTPQVGPLVKYRYSVTVRGGPGKLLNYATLDVSRFTNEEAKS